MAPLAITDSLVLPPKDLSWDAVRSRGPGGQNVNKVSSKVVLRFRLGASEAMTEALRARLRALFPNRINREDELIVACDTYRDQPRNLERARDILRDLILDALHVDKPRRPTKVPRGVKRRRVGDKRAHGEKKSSRSNRSFGE